MDTGLSLYHWSSLQRVEAGVWSSQSILWHTTNKHFSCYFKLDFLSDKAKADDGSNLKLQTGSTLKCKSVQQWLSAQIHFYKIQNLLIGEMPHLHFSAVCIFMFLLLLCCKHILSDARRQCRNLKYSVPSQVHKLKFRLTLFRRGLAAGGVEV